MVCHDEASGSFSTNMTLVLRLLVYGLRKAFLDLIFAEYIVFLVIPSISLECLICLEPSDKASRALHDECLS